MRVAPFVLALALLADVSTVHAAFTTDKCRVLNRQAWSALRKCQTGADVKRLKGKPADLLRCQTLFQEKLAKIDAKATKATIACRYGVNDDATVTDYDTGLMWETKSGLVGGLCLFLPGVISHCVNLTFVWADAQAYVGGNANSGDTIVPFLAGHADWRLPTSIELQSIIDLSAAGSGSGGACIDPIFGSTLAGRHWSSTTSATEPQLVYTVNFVDGSFFRSNTTGSTHPARAVRRAF